MQLGCGGLRLVRWMAVLCFPLLLIGCGSSSSSAPVISAASLASLAVRVADLPVPFYVGQTVDWSNARAAPRDHVTLSTYISHGRVRSYQRVLVRKQPAPEGLLLVDNEITEYRTAADARWGFGWLTTLYHYTAARGTTDVDIWGAGPGHPPTPLPTARPLHKHPAAPSAVPYRVATVPPVGEETRGFTVVSAAYAGEYAFRSDVILFRQGRFCAALRVVGFYGQVPLDTVVKVARTLDARIKNATRTRDIAALVGTAGMLGGVSTLL